MKKTIIAILLILGASAAYGQTPVPLPVVINPTTVEFDPSPDHDALIGPTTTPVVAGYLLKVYNILDEQDQPAIAEYDFGKPTPDPITHKIRVTTLMPFFQGEPLHNKVCYATVSAYGVGGVGTSADSNPFAIAPGPRPVVPAPVVK